MGAGYLACNGMLHAAVRLPSSVSCAVRCSRSSVSWHAGAGLQGGMTCTVSMLSICLLAANSKAAL